jgi:hypothetical protein
MKRLEVTWLDATSLIGGPWYDREEVLSEEGRRPVRVRSVGYLLHSDQKVLILAGSVHDARVSRVEIILRKTIVKRKRLR